MEYVENAGVYKVMGNLYSKSGKLSDANEAYKKFTGTYGRFSEAVRYIDPRKE